MAGSPESKARLSRRQRQILDFIRQSVQSRGFPPSIREIGEAVGLSSSSTVHSHLRNLESKGYVKRNPSKPRSIEILDGPKGQTARFVDLPVGEPGCSQEGLPETLSLPLELVGNAEAFLYPVRETYREEAIVPGDLLIVHRQEGVHEGDMVLAREGDSTHLCRANGRFSASEHKALVMGRVVGVIRKLS
ncbi:MAG TPA: transcriptional repressor LexA [Candidatus Nitrosotenuis sp.]|jgi:repressor LexA|nr:transcriptional repressor LexA [Candidatus Nitrosotenuis sp.]